MAQSQSHPTAAQKVGHMAGVLAHGLVSTAVTAVASVFEATLQGVAQTASNVGTEWQRTQSFANAARGSSTPQPQAQQAQPQQAPVQGAN